MKSILIPSYEIFMAATVFWLRFSVLLQEALDIKSGDCVVMLGYHVSFGYLSSSFYFPDYQGLRIQQWGGKCTFDLSVGKRNWTETPDTFSLTLGLVSCIRANHPFPRNGPNFWPSPPPTVSTWPQLSALSNPALLSIALPLSP